MQLLNQEMIYKSTELDVTSSLLPSYSMSYLSCLTVPENLLLFFDTQNLKRDKDRIDAVY